MSKVSKWLFSLAIVSGLSGALLTNASAEKSNASQLFDPEYAWFYYDGGSTSDPESFDKTAGTANDCMGAVSLCAIRAEIDPADNTHPLQSSLNGLNLSTPGANVKYTQEEGVK